MKNLFAGGVAVGILVLSWYICYVWIMALTEGWGAPWDTAPIRPPAGDWQRTLNDFFESAPGMYLPTFVFLGTSGLLFLLTVVRTQVFRVTSFIFGSTNLIAFAVLMTLIIPMQIFLIKTPAHLTPQDWSYWGDFTREWPLSLTALIVFAGLFIVQPRLTGYLARRTSNQASGGSAH
jgi:TRAP-type C4-dicarboxylate transport system permease large subunit